MWQRYQGEPSQPCTTSDQETDWVYSYNPGARTGPKNCKGDDSTAQGNTKEWGHKQIFLANHLASNDSLTRTTERENIYQLKLTIHKRGPNKQQYN